MKLNFKEFIRGMVAALVADDVTSIQPKRSEQRKALRAVYQFLADEAECARKSQNDALLKQIIRIRNSMSPGLTGTFDQFETALRDLQLSFTASPNPSYEDVDFTVSKPFALSYLKRLDKQSLALIQRAAAVYVDRSGIRSRHDSAA